LRAAQDAGDVIPLSDGRIGVLTGLSSGIEDDSRGVAVEGVFKFTTATALCILPGTRVYWAPTNETTAVKWAAGYHYLGVAVDYSLAGVLTCAVDINVQPKALIDLQDPLNTWTSAATDGLGTVWNFDDGLGCVTLAMDAVAEVAKADLLSDRSIPAGDGFIAHILAAVYDIGDNAALDINLGVASATHASDAESIASFVLFQLDGAALDLFAQSDDGTTDVTLFDTTKAVVDDTYHLFQIDASDLTDIQLYFDGVNVLPASTFTLEKNASAIKALVHIEKTSDNTTADVRVRELRVYPLD
jgi:predicted RecA/RadA family phage recombinase